MVYLPTFPININHSCRYIYIPVPWIVWVRHTWHHPVSTPSVVFHATDPLVFPSKDPSVAKVRSEPGGRLADFVGGPFLNLGF